MCVIIQIITCECFILYVILLHITWNIILHKSYITYNVSHYITYNYMYNYIHILYTCIYLYNYVYEFIYDKNSIIV